MFSRLSKIGGANRSPVISVVLPQVWLTASTAEEELNNQLVGMARPADVSWPLSLVTSELAQRAHEGVALLSGWRLATWIQHGLHVTETLLLLLSVPSSSNSSSLSSGYDIIS